MNNAAIGLICPVCNKTWIINCDDLTCDNCRFYSSTNKCLKFCKCSATNIMMALQSQIYQLQTENESLLHERNIWKIFLTEKGEWYNAK